MLSKKAGTKVYRFRRAGQLDENNCQIMAERVGLKPPLVRGR
jgi:hypothetical protein